MLATKTRGVAAREEEHRPSRTAVPDCLAAASSSGSPDVHGAARPSSTPLAGKRPDRAQRSGRALSQKR